MSQRAFGTCFFEQYAQISLSALLAMMSLATPVKAQALYGTSFFLLREANPWLRSDHLTNKSGKIYHIAIP